MSFYVSLFTEDYRVELFDLVRKNNYYFDNLEVVYFDAQACNFTVSYKPGGLGAFVFCICVIFILTCAHDTLNKTFSLHYMEK